MKPKRAAAALAMVLLPAPEGPSMATEKCLSILTPLMQRICGDERRRPGYLQIISARVGVQVQHLARKVQAGHELGLHSARDSPPVVATPPEVTMASAIGLGPDMATGKCFKSDASAGPLLLV